MSEMVERVARAIFEAFDRYAGGGYVGAYRFPKGMPGNDTVLDGQWNLDNIARAAIGAMREPTQEMIDAAPLDILTDYQATVTWKSMIDEALIDEVPK